MSTKTRKRFILVFTSACLIILLMVIVVSLSGPRLRKFRLTDTFNQQLILEFSSQIAEVNEINILPNPEYSLQIRGSSVVVNLKDPLKYTQEYKIHIKVTDKRENSSMSSLSFETKNPDIYFLKRQNEQISRIYRTKLRADRQAEIFYESEKIILYDLSPKIALILEGDDRYQELKAFDGKSVNRVSVPDDLSIDSIDASDKSDIFIISTSNKKSYEKTLWQYDSKEDSLKQISFDNRPIQGTDAVFAPDGKSIFYTDSNLTLQLANKDGLSPPLSLGVFDDIARILPNETGIFGSKSGLYRILLSETGEELFAPEEVQLSAELQTLNNLRDYVFITQELDNDLVSLEQKLIFLEDGKNNILTRSSLRENLITKAALSDNDQFVITETAKTPFVFDGVIPNSLPKDGYSNIIDLNSGVIVKEIDGFNIKLKI